MKLKILTEKTDNNLINSNIDIKDLIEICKSKKIKTENIFNINGAKLVDPKEWFERATEDTSDSYKKKKFQRVLLNDKNDFYYKALYDFAIGKLVNKIEPAVEWTNGVLDGAHRAVLCMLLGIKLPVVQKDSRG